MSKVVKFMKTAVWLYLFMFVAFFDLHAQYPILSPFALSLGAAPSFIGFILGMYSITHLPGNLIAGYGVDRYGSKPFIVSSLIVAGIVLIFQSKVTDPWQLLIIRSISGFVLAFLSPACLAMLAKIARDRVHQGKLMAGNGLVHTLASVVSPAAGAYLVAKFGFAASFSFLGWGLIITGLLAIPGVKERRAGSSGKEAEKLELIEHPQHHHGHGQAAHGAARGNGPEVDQAGRAGRKNAGSRPTVMSEDELNPAQNQTIPLLFFLIPLAVSCSQGILFFELPLMKSTNNSVLTSGILFSLVSLGALVTLSMLFLNRFSSFSRTIFGSLALALIFFGMSVHWPVPLYTSLFLIGMTKGVIFPAMSTLLAALTSASRYGRMFSLLSISFSIGAFIGPVVAGQLRLHMSSYFLAFACLMLALTLLPFRMIRSMA